MSTKPLNGFEHLFAQELPELETIDMQIQEKLATLNLSPEIPFYIVDCRVDLSRLSLQNSRFSRRQHGLYLLMREETGITSVRCLLLSKEEYMPALKGVVLTAKLLLTREVIPFWEFELKA